MHRSLVIPLAFVAGWVDAASFVGLDHLMAAHITGNLVVLAANVEHGFEASDLLKIVILPVFFTGVMVVTWVHDGVIARHPDRARHLPRLLLIEAMLLSVTAILGAWSGRSDVPLGFWLGLLVVTPAVFAMAIQNAAHRLYPSIGPATTVMTGNITQFFIDRARQLKGHLPVSAIDDMPVRSWILPPVILAFGTGCVLGALATGRVGNASFIVPAAAVALCAVMLHRPSSALPGATQP